MTFVLHARPRRPMLTMGDTVARVAGRFGNKTALEWTKAVLGHQSTIDEAALRSAIASGNIDRIEAVVRSAELQAKVGQAVGSSLQQTMAAAGQASAAALSAHGITMQFNAVHPNVVQFARDRAAELVVRVPQETKQIIAEVIARGAERGLTTAEQARAIREVVGLPPQWKHAPGALADELRSGEISAATSRRLSAATAQKIRSRAMAGTLSESFISDVVSEYTASLIHARAIAIARTETQRAANHGLQESWSQAAAQGVLPKSARRFWIVTPDSRLSEEHATIPGMNTAGRRLDEPFETTEGLCMYPPSRPNCRCSVALAFTDGEDILSDVTAPSTRTPPPRSTTRGSTTGQSAPLEPAAVTPVGRGRAAVGEPVPPQPIRVPKGATPEIHAAVSETLQEMNIDPKVVRYFSDKKVVVRGDQRGVLLGDYGKGEIRINAGADQSLKQLQRTVAHEGTHLQFDAALQVDKTLQRDIMRDLDGLMQDDGVTTYSRAHWKEAAKWREDWDLVAFKPLLAVNETLAEIRAMEQLGRVVGAPRYRALLARVDKAYAKAAKKGLKLGGRQVAARRARLAVEARPVKGLQGDKAAEYLDKKYAKVGRAVKRTEQALYEEYATGDYILQNELMRLHGNDPMAWIRAEGKKPIYKIPHRQAELRGSLTRMAKEAAARNKKLAAHVKKLPPLDQPVTVYRGITAPPELLSQLRVGSTFTDKGFVSTTTDQVEAKKWLKQTSAEWQQEHRGARPVMLEVTLPKGTRGAWVPEIAPDAAYRSVVQDEFLLPPGTKFKVMPGSSKTLIKVQVLP